MMNILKQPTLYAAMLVQIKILNQNMDKNHLNEPAVKLKQPINDKMWCIEV
jgi:hypothetical protein